MAVTKCLKPTDNGHDFGDCANVPLVKSCIYTCRAITVMNQVRNSRRRPSRATPSKTQHSAEVIDLDVARALATVVLAERALAGRPGCLHRKAGMLCLRGDRS